jgi:hypothetical protein
LKIYDAAILALKEIDRPAKVEEILEVIKRNHWFEFNTTNELSVLRLQIRRRSIGYAGLNYAKNKNFSMTNDMYSLIVESEQNEELKYNKENVPWKMLRDKYLNEIKKVLKENKLSLFIGAGISTSAGLPKWETLLEKINEAVYKGMKSKKVGGKLSFIETTDKEDKIMTSLLSKLGDESPIINAAFLESTLGSTSAMSKEIRKALYGTTSKKMYHSKELRWLAKLCNHRGNYQIQSVVTFNYDDLLEQHLMDVPVTHMSIFKEEDEVIPNTLPVYHVHGYLPQFSRETDSHPLVITEHSYHSVYTDAYSWSNITQLIILKENTCLFLGLSMNDPNLRRILDIAARKNHNKLKHFAFMLRLELVVAEEQLKEVSDTISPELLEAFLDDFHLSREKHFENLGIRIVWYEDYEELPNLLRNLVK